MFRDRRAKKMGVLLLPDETSRSRASLPVVGEANNNASDLTDANSRLPSQPTTATSAALVGVGKNIDIVNGVERELSSQRRNGGCDWMPPPPKKKWIRHYLLGEITPSVFYVSRRKRAIPRSRGNQRSTRVLERRYNKCNIGTQH